jgi:uncharacterized integral membrane protein
LKDVPAWPARPLLDSGGALRRNVDTEQWQPRLWAVLVGLTLLALYVIAFVVKNDDQIQIDFVLFKATVSLIWTIVFILALGILAGVLLSQLYRRRRGKRAREPDRGVGEAG